MDRLFQVTWVLGRIRYRESEEGGALPYSGGNFSENVGGKQNLSAVRLVVGLGMFPSTALKAWPVFLLLLIVTHVRKWNKRNRDLAVLSTLSLSRRR